jgi:phosphoserine phosphatase
MKEQRILMTVTGPDRPGITSSLTGVLAESNVGLLDIEQVVVQGQLTLCLLIDVGMHSELGETVVKNLLFEAKKLGQEIDFREIEVSRAMDVSAAKVRYVLTVLGDPIGAESLHVLSTILANHDANIDSIRRLSRVGLSSLEINIALPKGEGIVTKLKEELMQQMAHREVDIALQRETLTRRNKRLVALDMDSTLIQTELIDELARAHGVYDAVSSITRKAMNGEFDFRESLQRRVALLAGLDARHLHELADHMPLTEGAEDLVKVLKGLGYKVGIISGGFSVAADRLRDSLGLDFAYANKLEIVDNKLSGKVEGPVVDAEKKADLLAWVAHKEGIPLEQTIAIGDGANDALMLAQAGLGIAFHAKASLRKSADTSVSSGGLEKILYLLGMNAHDVEDFLRS